MCRYKASFLSFTSFMFFVSLFVCLCVLVLFSLFRFSTRFAFAFHLCFVLPVCLSSVQLILFCFAPFFCFAFPLFVLYCSGHASVIFPFTYLFSFFPYICSFICYRLYVPSFFYTVLPRVFLHCLCFALILPFFLVPDSFFVFRLCLFPCVPSAFVLCPCSDLALIRLFFCCLLIYLFCFCLFRMFPFLYNNGRTMRRIMLYTHLSLPQEVTFAPSGHFITFSTVPNAPFSSFRSRITREAQFNNE